MESLRRNPYRLFFPLGAVIGAIGVGYWLAYTAGWTRTYEGYGHALVQVEGFLLCFAIGFLCTMIPRRMQVEPPGAVGLLGAAVLVVVASAASMMGERVVSQAATLVVLAWLAAFALRRLTAGTARKPPDAFILLPIAFAMGVTAVVLLLLVELDVVGPVGALVGRTLLQEGVFLCLVLGIGRFLLPVLFGHGVPGDMAPTRESRRARAGHAAAGLALFATFLIQPWLQEALGVQPGIRVIYGARFAIVLTALLAARPWRLPVKVGSQRSFVWIAAWLVPTGLLLAAIFPQWRIAMMHVTYVGGFALMSLAVGGHVILAHGGWDHLVHGRPWWMRGFGLLVLFSVTVRVTADAWPAAYWTHVAAAAGAWLLGLALWLGTLVPKLGGAPPPTTGPTDPTERTKASATP